MNKILGILLFTAMTVGSGTIAFAEDSNVTGDNTPNINEDTSSENEKTLPDSKMDNKQVLYDDVVDKNNIYNSIKRDDYENNSEYFEELTIAWDNYVDALALYDNTTDSVALKNELNDNIEKYLKTCDDMELLYNNTKEKKVVYDELLNDFKNDDSYFDNLRLAWEEYLDALFLYDGTIDVSFWFDQLDESISNYQNNFNDIMENYVKLVQMKEYYDNESSEVTDYLESNIVNDSYFDDLRLAWDNYVDALFEYDNNASSDFDALRAELNTSIEQYFDYLDQAQILLDNITNAKNNYDYILSEVMNYSKSNIVDDSYFDDLRNAWSAYIDAWNAWDLYYGTNSTQSIDDLENWINEYEKFFEGKPVDQNLSISAGNETEVGNGWGNVEDAKDLPKISSNQGELIILNKTNDFEIKIVTSNHDKWQIVINSNVSFGELNFTLYYQYGPDGSTKIFKNLFQIFIFGNGSISFDIVNATGTGPDSIDEVRVGNITFNILPEFEGPSTYLPEINSPGLDLPHADVPEGPTDPEFVGIESFLPELFCPPFVGPVGELPESPVYPPENSSDGNGNGNVTLPQDSANESNASLTDNNGEIAKFAKSGMKKTGLPIGIILALLMSLLVIIRIKK